MSQPSSSNLKKIPFLNQVSEKITTLFLPFMIFVVLGIKGFFHIIVDNQRLHKNHYSASPQGFTKKTTQNYHYLPWADIRRKKAKAI